MARRSRMLRAAACFFVVVSQHVLISGEWINVNCGEDCGAMIDLSMALGVPGGWLSGEGYCEWSGVVCNEDDRVVHISLSHLEERKNQSRELPEGIFSRLQKLESLAFVNCSLGGKVPQDLSLNLKELYLNENQFIGPISKILSRSQLRVLHLDGNAFQGLLGPLFAALPETIESVSVSRNYFYGPLPAASLARLRNLEYLRLGGNQLSGPLPTRELAALPKLKQLSIYGNTNLTGPLVPLLSPSLEQIEATATSVSGELDLGYLLRIAPKLKRLQAGGTSHQLRLASSDSSQLDSMHSLALWGNKDAPKQDDSVLGHLLSEPVSLGGQFDIDTSLEDSSRKHPPKAKSKSKNDDKRHQQRKRLEEAAEERRRGRLAASKARIAQKLNESFANTSQIDFFNHTIQEENTPPKKATSSQRKTSFPSSKQQQQPHRKHPTTRKRNDLPSKSKKEPLGPATTASTKQKDEHSIVEKEESQIDDLTSQMLTRLQEARQRAGLLKRVQ